ncbi:cell wall hydrolase [Pseudomonas abieticivorans]|uniref:cell wall hydrolase n=1 Tax=Pseudomonas abieticivorans TaxID=2931382 RepID=UPI0020BED3B0|nr:cell wall hydrolase [Pseudomonas sp. PIA16]
MRLVRLTACIAIAFFGGQALAADPVQSPEVVKDKAQVLEHKVADKEGAVPKAATITKAEAQVVDPAGEASVNDTLTCLSRTIYWEAKGGNAQDMSAVANVVLNRLGHDGFPSTICEVVKEGQSKKACQFSWWCDGRSDDVEEPERYDIAKEIARKALNQQLPDNTGGAMYFHDRNVSPAWVKQYIETAHTDKFLFYKPHDGKAK